MGHWIPVTWLTLGLDYVVWGINPFGYHLTNLLWHAASAALFYLVARRLLGLGMPSASPLVRGLGATGAALFFAIHPLRVESVAWITERRDLTSGFFLFLAVLSYLKAHERRAETRTGWWLIAFVATALALGSKAITMGLPLVLLLLDFYPLRRIGPGPRDWLSPPARPVWLEKIPFLLLAAAAAVIAFNVQRGTGYLTPATPGTRLAITAHNVWFHAWKTFVPLNLSPVYELPLAVNPLERPYLLSALAGLAITLAVWIFRRRSMSTSPCDRFMLTASNSLETVSSGWSKPIRIQSNSARHSWRSCVKWIRMPLWQERALCRSISKPGSAPVALTWVCSAPSH